MKLLFQIDESVISYYKNNPYNYDNENVGVDLYFDDDYIVPAGKKALLKFGIKCEVINEFGRNVAYFLVPRSSISKTPLIQANSIGIIDAGYRGYIMAMVYNTSDIDYSLKKGERLFQLVPINNGKPFNSIEIVSTLSETIRGTGGFGSTGV